MLTVVWPACQVSFHLDQLFPISRRSWMLDGHIRWVHGNESIFFIHLSTQKGHFYVPFQHLLIRFSRPPPYWQFSCSPTTTFFECGNVVEVYKEVGIRSC